MTVKLQDRLGADFDSMIPPNTEMIAWCVDCEMPLLLKELDVISTPVRWYDVAGERLSSIPLCPVCKRPYIEYLTRQEYEDRKNRARLEKLGLIIPDGVSIH